MSSDERTALAEKLSIPPTTARQTTAPQRTVRSGHQHRSARSGGGEPALSQLVRQAIRAV
jgi:hypothetical protein